MSGSAYALKAGRTANGSRYLRHQPLPVGYVLESRCTGSAAVSIANRSLQRHHNPAAAIQCEPDSGAASLLRLLPIHWRSVGSCRPLHRSRPLRSAREAELPPEPEPRADLRPREHFVPKGVDTCALAFPGEMVAIRRPKRLSCHHNRVPVLPLNLPDPLQEGVSLEGNLWKAQYEGNLRPGRLAREAAAVIHPAFRPITSSTYTCMKVRIERRSAAMSIVV